MFRLSGAPRLSAFAQEPPTTRAVSAGCSMNGMCGAPGITAKRAPGIASAILCTTGGGLDLSNSPTRHSAGTLISFSRGAVSIVAIACQASAQPRTSVESRRSRTAASPPRIHERVVEPAPHRDVENAADAVALRVRAALRHDLRALRRLRRGARRDHDCARVLRIFHRERLRHHPAEREARDRARREVQLGQQRVHVVGVVGEARGRLVGRFAVPAQVGAQHGELLRQRRRDRVEEGEVDPDRVQQQRRAGRCRRCDDVV